MYSILPVLLIPFPFKFPCNLDFSVTIGTDGRGDPIYEITEVYDVVEDYETIEEYNVEEEYTQTTVVAPIATSTTTVTATATRESQ